MKRRSFLKATALTSGAVCLNVAGFRAAARAHASPGSGSCQYVCTSARPLADTRENRPRRSAPSMLHGSAACVRSWGQVWSWRADQLREK